MKQIKKEEQVSLKDFLVAQRSILNLMDRVDRLEAVAISLGISIVLVGIGSVLKYFV